jgi:hypothetical protein
MLVRRGMSGAFLTYTCPQHGRFWIDDDGRLREEQRAADRPRQSR